MRPWSDGPARADRGDHRPPPTCPRLGLLVFPILPFAIISLFAIYCLFAVHGAGDGGWNAYAMEIMAGSGIYSELHAVQQPLFLLLSAAAESMSGGRETLFKLFLAPIAIAYAIAVLRVCSLAEMPPWGRAFLSLLIFFLGIGFEAFRFDDYHALLNVIAMASFVAAAGAIRSGPSATLAITLGFLSGLAIVTRVNDGAAILVANLLVLSILAGGARRAATLAIPHIAAAAIPLLACLALLGETPSAWLRSTMLDAVAAKGGAGIAMTPLLLVANSLSFLVSPDAGVWPSRLSPWLAIAEISACAAILRLSAGRRGWPATAVAVALLHVALTRLLVYDLTAAFYSAIILLALLSSLPAAVVSLVARRGVGRSPLLLLYPLGLFLSGASSSGGAHFGLYFPAALALACMAIIPWGGASRRAWVLGVALPILSPLLLFSVAFKTLHPYSWHDFTSSSLFEPREIFHSANRGPILLERGVASLFRSICPRMDAGGELLSLPFPGPNHYCGMPRWNRHVQSFYDLTTGPVVDRLVSDLEASPPRYVVYQRQPGNLARHERLFNGGMPLPHRRLDGHIWGKASSGEWAVLDCVRYGSDSVWFVLRTDAPGSSFGRPDCLSEWAAGNPAGGQDTRPLEKNVPPVQSPTN